MSTVSTEPVMLVTGSSGFVGRALTDELRKSDAPFRPRELRLLDIRAPLPDSRQQSRPFHLVDVRDRAGLQQACEGVDVVVHLAAMVDWGQHSPEEVREVNLEGTRNLIAACHKARVRALVFVSTLDVVYSGKPIHEADESLPYPSEYPTEYCRSKADAERAVLAADSSPFDHTDPSAGRLRTIVMRPCAIWGEHDPYHVTAMLKLARLGPVVRLGRKPALSQFVYVRNVAHALLCAARALWEGRPGAGGEVFFITDHAPRGFFDHLAPIVRAAGGRMMPRALALPYRPMRAFALGLGWLTRTLRPLWAMTPLVTPFSVDYVCQEFTVRGGKAERLLGYQPIYSEADAYARTLEWVRTLRA